MNDSALGKRQSKFSGIFKKLGITATVFIAVIIVLALWLTWPFLTNRGPVYYSDIDEHFRYGSIG